MHKVSVVPAACATIDDGLGRMMLRYLHGSSGSTSCTPMDPALDLISQLAPADGQASGRETLRARSRLAGTLKKAWVGPERSIKEYPGVTR